MTLDDFTYDHPDRDVAAFKRAIANKLIYGVGKDPRTATRDDWLMPIRAESIAAPGQWLARLAEQSGLKHGAVQDKLFLPGLRKLDMLRRAGFFGRMLSVRGELFYKDHTNGFYGYNTSAGDSFVLELRGTGFTEETVLSGSITGQHITAHFTLASTPAGPAICA